jgi:hypothetical protein
LELTTGGADAEPFATHHKALDLDMYLRISLELPLKKLLVGGFEKVFEIGRIFRNEGIDAEHLQDYTQLEFYWAYADYKDLMRFIEKSYKQVIKATVGSLQTVRNGETIDWSKKWEKIDYFTIFKEQTGIDLNKATEADLKAYAISQKLDIAKHSGKGRLIDLIFKKIRHTLIQPCFLVNPPVEVEPLAKRLKPGSNKVARFQIIAGGTELGPLERVRGYVDGGITRSPPAYSFIVQKHFLFCTIVHFPFRDPDRSTDGRGEQKLAHCAGCRSICSFVISSSSPPCRGNCRGFGSEQQLEREITFHISHLMFRV